MIKLYILLAFAFPFLTFCKAPNKALDCEMFKVGKFKIQSRIDDSYWIIERHDSIQVETNTRTGDTTFMKIIWNAPCEYKLSRLTFPKFQSDSLLDRANRIPLLVKILSVTKDYCVFESHKEGIKMVYSDTLWIYRN